MNGGERAETALAHECLGGSFTEAADVVETQADGDVG